MNKILKPGHYDAFACIMDKCENHCCKEWRIDFDKKSFKHYEKLGILKNTDGNKRAARNPQHTSTLDYGYAVLDDNLVCSFLKDGLCEIQKKYGSESLSITCDTYPRKHNDMVTHLEYSLSISCPEVARKLLLNEEPLEFSFCEANHSLKSPPKFIIDLPNLTSVDGLMYYFWDIRAFSIAILQNRQYTLNERLIILGYFIKMLNKLESSAYQETINTINQLEALMNNPEVFKEQLGDVSIIQFKPSLNFLESFSNELESNSFMNGNFRQMIDHMTLGLQLSPESQTYQRSKEIFEESFAEYFLPFLKDHEYVFENLLVNEIYTRLFPFYDKSLDVVKSYNNLMLIFYMVQFSLTGVAAYEKRLDKDILIEVVHALYRRIEHSDSLLDIFAKCE